MILFRSHQSPLALQWYQEKLEEGYLPTLKEANECLGEGDREVEIHVSETLYLQCVSAESLEIWGDHLKGGPTIQVNTRRGPFRKCPICLEKTTREIKCGCPFHRECIRESSRWKPTCPTCMDPLSPEPLCISQERHTSAKLSETKGDR